MYAEAHRRLDQTESALAAKSQHTVIHQNTPFETKISNRGRPPPSSYPTFLGACGAFHACWAQPAYASTSATLRCDCLCIARCASAINRRFLGDYRRITQIYRKSPSKLTWQMHYLRQGARYAITTVSLSFALPVSRITAEAIGQLHWNLILGLPIGRTTCTFGGDPVPDTNSGSLFHFPHHCGIENFLGDLDLLAFLIQSPADIVDSRRAVIRIRIWINPEIQTRIADHFWLRLNALAEVCFLWTQSSLGYTICK